MSAALRPALALSDKAKPDDLATGGASQLRKRPAIARLLLVAEDGALDVGRVMALGHDASG